jgi:hypothetical protein
MANRAGWVRFAPPPRDLSRAAKLAREAEVLLSGTCSAGHPCGSGDQSDFRR